MDIVNGLFVRAIRFINEKQVNCFVKLSEIKTIEDYEPDVRGNERCNFYTYKDCYYYAWIGSDDLVKAVNDLYLEKKEPTKKFKKKK